MIDRSQLKSGHGSAEESCDPGSVEEIKDLRNIVLGNFQGFKSMMTVPTSKQNVRT